MQQSSRLCRCARAALVRRTRFEGDRREPSLSRPGLWGIPEETLGPGALLSGELHTQLALCNWDADDQRQPCRVFRKEHLDRQIGLGPFDVAEEPVRLQRLIAEPNSLRS